MAIGLARPVPETVEEAVTVSGRPNVGSPDSAVVEKKVLVLSIAVVRVRVDVAVSTTTVASTATTVANVTVTTVVNGGSALFSIPWAGSWMQLHSSARISGAPLISAHRWSDPYGQVLAPAGIFRRRCRSLVLFFLFFCSRPRVVVAVLKSRQGKLSAHFDYKEYRDSLGPGLSTYAISSTMLTSVNVLVATVVVVMEAVRGEVTGSNSVEITVIVVPSSETGKTSEQ